MDIQQLARLARLALAEDEAEMLAAQMEKVMVSAQVLRNMDLSAVEPMVNPFSREIVLECDCPQPGLGQRGGLAPAKRVCQGMFRVPPLFEDGE